MAITPSQFTARRMSPYDARLGDVLEGEDIALGEGGTAPPSRSTLKKVLFGIDKKRFRGPEPALFVQPDFEKKYEYDDEYYGRTGSEDEYEEMVEAILDHVFSGQIRVNIAPSELEEIISEIGAPLPPNVDIKRLRDHPIMMSYLQQNLPEKLFLAIDLYVSNPAVYSDIFHRERLE